MGLLVASLATALQAFLVSLGGQSCLGRFAVLPYGDKYGSGFCYLRFQNGKWLFVPFTMALNNFINNQLYMDKCKF